VSAVFCDTSALYAVVNRNDSAHGRARRAWEALAADTKSQLVTTNYIVVEMITLVQARAGIEAARQVRDLFDALVRVGFVGDALHDRALDDLFAHEARTVSLVDYTSFAFMRRHRIDTAFAYDSDFAVAGFRLYEPAT
jgi:predicted nucleic acid-binding protein